MENSKNNKGIMTLLIVIIVILSALYVLFATGTISFNSNKTNDNDINGNSQQVDKNLNEQDSVGRVLTEDEAQNIIKSVMKKSFNYIYALSPECGDKNKSDTVQENNHTYEASSSYTTLNDLKSYLHTFLSDYIINSVEEKYVVDKYKEKDNKLYCLNSGKGCGWIYNDTDTNYTIGSITSDEIKAGGNIYYETCGNEKKAIPVSFVLKRNNDNNWILDTYLSK